MGEFDDILGPDSSPYDDEKPQQIEIDFHEKISEVMNKEFEIEKETIEKLKKAFEFKWGV